jgi:hypothetical protein
MSASAWKASAWEYGKDRGRTGKTFQITWQEEGFKEGPMGPEEGPMAHLNDKGVFKNDCGEARNEAPEGFPRKVSIGMDVYIDFEVVGPMEEFVLRASQQGLVIVVGQ